VPQNAIAAERRPLNPTNHPSTAWCTRSRPRLCHGPVGDEEVGELRTRHYHRKNRAVSLADCVAVEAARAHHASLASADPHLLDVCRDEDISVIALPDSTGHTWSP
jgi:hypothetical protein